MEEQVELLRYLEILNKKRIVIVVGTLLCLFAAIAVTASEEPVYEASVQVLVSQGQLTSADQSLRESYQAILMSERLTKTFSKMLENRTLAERVVKKLELPLLPEDLQSKVSAKPIKDTQLIEVVVTDKDPVLAKNLANTYASEFALLSAEAMPASMLASVSLIEAAVVPIEPFKPRPLLNAVLALFFGFIASVSLVLLIDVLDVTIKEKEEVEKLIGLHAVGKIPRAEEPVLFTGINPKMSEAYRSIRTNLQYLGYNKPFKTMIVTSANADEGKTTVSANLAIVFAQAGSKVLLIDCDLRRPSLGRVFNNSTKEGLSNGLVGIMETEAMIQRTRIKGLDIILSGPIPPNPSDLLGSPKMSSIIAELSEVYDFIIMDCPPVLAVADAPILASKTDAVLLVSSYGKTKKTEISAAKESLENVGARMVGFVINNAATTAKNGYDRYYETPHIKPRAVEER